MPRKPKASRHSDRTNYIVWALWLKGLSESSIASATGLGRKQISGIVGRSPYSNRSAMSDGERQKKLDELLAIRIGDDGVPLDGGRLDRMDRAIVPLSRAQRKGRA